MTYKDENDLSNYSVLSVAKDSYKIQNGIMYISFDGKNTVEVPGDFSKMIDSYNEYNYQISNEKTIFYYINDSKRYLRNITNAIKLIEIRNFIAFAIR